MMDLIPGLPHDIGMECLVRVPFNQIHNFKLVCKDWKAEMELPEFYLARKSANKAQTLVVLAHSLVIPDAYNDDDDHLYHFVALEPETGCWWKMPSMPEPEAGLPVVCEMIASGSQLVVMGGKDPKTREYLDSVFAFDFFSYKWHRGANMPGGHRSFFSCASDGNGTIFVAGGYDVNINPLKSAWAYHVSTDSWTQLPDMAKERRYCKGLFHLGKFHVINQFPNDLNVYQSLEIFDTSSRQWLILGSDDEDKIIQSPNICVQGTDHKLYTCFANDVVVLEDNKWKFVARLPADVANRPYITQFPGHLLLTGETTYNHPHNTFKLDLKDLIWTRLEVPMEFPSHVRSGCCFII